MSLPHALLTSLVERPGAGLDLARRFERSIGYFWQASHQQIYRELGRMEAAGWIAGDDVPGRGRKREYRVLASGRAELARWVAEEGPVPAQRDALLVRLRADAAIGPVEMVEQVRHRLQQHQARLALYRDIEARDFAGPLTREGRVQHLVLRAGIVAEEAGVGWCREALTVLAEDPVT